MLDGHVIDEVFGGSGENQAADAVDGHQEETENEQAAARLDERPDIG